MRLPASEIEAVVEDVRWRGGRIGFEAKVWGTSMAPNIDHGDRILVESVPLEAIAPADVIVYRGEHGRSVAHRLVRVENRGDETVLVTRSDAPGALEERVASSQVIGRVIGVERTGPLERIWTKIRSVVARVERALR
jgi:signal peptidase I